MWDTRFRTQDPIGLAGGINLYSYAGSNPVSYLDPFGLEVQFKNEKGEHSEELEAVWKHIRRTYQRVLREGSRNEKHGAKTVLDAMRDMEESSKLFTFQIDNSIGAYGETDPVTYQAARINMNRIANEWDTQRPATTMIHEAGHMHFRHFSARGAWRGLLMDGGSYAVEFENVYRAAYGMCRMKVHGGQPGIYPPCR